jgi:hypothetical protein
MFGQKKKSTDKVTRLVAGDTGPEDSGRGTGDGSPSARGAALGTGASTTEHPEWQATERTKPEVVTDHQGIEGLDNPPQTRIVGAGTGRDSPSVDVEGDDAAMSDPPAGWLVVVDGPGRGNVLTVGLGQNHIGSAANQRVRIDFGDPTISGNHAVLVYDPRSRKFLIGPGTGKNLVYLRGNGAPVLTPTELQAGTVVELGGTALRFVPFCGPSFSWSDQK